MAIKEISQVRGRENHGEGTASVCAGSWIVGKLTGQLIRYIRKLQFIDALVITVLFFDFSVSCIDIGGSIATDRVANFLRVG